MKLRSVSRRRARGFTLIEVLVVLALFSVGLIGVVAMQARAAQFSVGAEDSTRAALLANELAATMWGAGTVSLAGSEVDTWNTRVANMAAGGLPNGSGAVVVTNNVARITVSWRPPQDPATATRRYVTEVTIPVVAAASGAGP
jgi:type IV pilus assembly protein PilV